MHEDAYQTDTEDIVDEYVSHFRQLAEQQLNQIDENTTVGVTGKPRTTRNLEMPVDNATRYVVMNTDATVKVHQESDQIEVDRGLGTPKWKFPNARDNRNPELQFYKGPNEDILANTVNDVDLHIIGDFASYTGHEQGMEHRQETHGIESLSETDLEADTVIASTNRFPYFTDLESDNRSDGDFEDYLLKAEAEIQKIGEGYKTTVFGEDFRASEEYNGDMEPVPGQIYIVGERK